MDDFEIVGDMDHTYLRVGVEVVPHVDTVAEANTLRVLDRTMDTTELPGIITLGNGLEETVITFPDDDARLPNALTLVRYAVYVLPPSRQLDGMVMRLEP